MSGVIAGGFSPSDEGAPRYRRCVDSPSSIRSLEQGRFVLGLLVHKEQQASFVSPCRPALQTRIAEKRWADARSAGQGLNSCTLADYVDDVRTVADLLPRLPVVIGHSMGGAVVQKYLTVENAPAGVLVASAPPSGLGLAALRFTRRHPGHCARSRALRVPLRLFGAPPVARATFYSRHTPEQRIAEYVGMLQDESIRVLYRDLLYSDLPQPERVTTSMLVVGAELDGFFSPREVAATARAYGTRAGMFPDMGHNMMLEPGWAEVAEYIYEWLDDRGL